MNWLNKFRFIPDFFSTPKRAGAMPWRCVAQRSFFMAWKPGGRRKRSLASTCM
jgi:hypothetical protein